MSGAAALVPVKAFSAGKARLAASLDPEQRAALAERLATRVLLACRPLPTFVACDSASVARWANAVGAEVVWTEGRDLNGSAAAGFAELSGRGYTRVAVVHADLAHPTPIEPLTWFPGATVVPDRRGDGTNVLVVPTAIRACPPDTLFAYGPGSARRHVARLRSAALAVRVVHNHPLGWDVDVPGDLTGLRLREEPC